MGQPAELLTAPEPPSRRLAQALPSQRNLVEESVRDLFPGTRNPPPLATVLYGSHARGTADRGSDLDILEVVHGESASREALGVSITQYRPAHLRRLAERGSLFILHLLLEAKVVDDAEGIFADCLDAYVQPQDYDAQWDLLRRASAAVDPSLSDSAKYCQGLVRLGIYLLRTSLYIRGIDEGFPSFDLATSTSVESPLIRKAISMRRQSLFELPDLAILRRALDAVLPEGVARTHLSAMGLAVSTSNDPALSSLLAGALSEKGVIEYSDLTLPVL